MFLVALQINPVPANYVSRRKETGPKEPASRSLQYAAKIAIIRHRVENGASISVANLSFSSTLYGR
jgi:hypothetical protein